MAGDWIGLSSKFKTFEFQQFGNMQIFQPILKLNETL